MRVIIFLKNLLFFPEQRMEVFLNRKKSIFCLNIKRNKIRASYHIRRSLLNSTCFHYFYTNGNLFKWKFKNEFILYLYSLSIYTNNLFSIYLYKWKFKNEFIVYLLSPNYSIISTSDNSDKNCLIRIYEELISDHSIIFVLFSIIQNSYRENHFHL